MLWAKKKIFTQINDSILWCGDDVDSQSFYMGYQNKCHIIDCGSFEEKKIAYKHIWK